MGLQACRRTVAAAQRPFPSLRSRPVLSPRFERFYLELVAPLVLSHSFIL